MKKASIALILLLAVMLVAGVACVEETQGMPYNLDDYYIGTHPNLHLTEPVLLYIALSWDCEKGGWTFMKVYDDSGREVGETGLYSEEMGGWHVTTDGEMCSATPRVRYMPLNESFKAGSMYELVITTQWLSTSDGTIKAWNEEHNHIIYPQVR